MYVYIILDWSGGSFEPLGLKVKQPLGIRKVNNKKR